MIRFSFLIILFLCCGRVKSNIDVDSIFHKRYTKTFSDSVFVVNDLIRAPEIRFDLGNTLRVDYLANDSIKKIADFLIKYPLLVVEISCHTDCRGSNDSNQSLSVYRANAVVNVLIQLFGNDTLFAERIRAVGKGESDLLIPEQTVNSYKADQNLFELYHQVNRRIEIKVVALLGKNFYSNRRAASNLTLGQTRNSAYYEDLILIADKALLEGDLSKALQFYSYAADVAPVNETYARDQRNKVKALLEN